MKEKDRRKRTSNMTARKEFGSTLLALKIEEWETKPKNADGFWRPGKK